jgi:hypothetical protein
VNIAGAFRMVDQMGHGETIRWFRMVGRCPCFDPSTGEWNRAHALCGGLGVLREEVDVSAYRAQVTSVQAGRTYDRRLGQLEEGDLTVSVWPNEIPLAEQDQIVVPSRAFTFSEQITRGAGLSDTLTQLHPLSVERVFDTNGVVSSSLYSLSGQTLVWDGGPAAGQRYTVRYRYSPRYTVIQGKILSRKPDPDGTPLPMVVGMRLWTPSDLD